MHLTFYSQLRALLPLINQNHMALRFEKACYNVICQYIFALRSTAMELIAGAGKSCIKFLKVIQPNVLLAGIQAPSINSLQIRHTTSKHWNPKWKKLRREKYIKPELPNFEEKSEDIPREVLRSRMKQRGVLPPRPWLERPFYISCTGGIFEPYVPPEGDGKRSIISRTGAKQKLEFLEKKSKSMLAVRKIRSYEEEFDSTLFATQAQDIYVKSHQLMAEKKKYEIRDVITERAYPEIMHNVKDKTIHWSFLQSLEPPRVVHARCTDLITKDNIFAQVTVRFHTQQLLAIYDRFGRLMHGSETIPKDVLEYVVFEKHISNEYGLWRLHEKIVPDWLPPRAPAPITYRIPDEPEQVLDAIEPPKDEKVQQIEAAKSEESKEKVISA